ncbi:Ester hydrolase C11orf54-like protein [Hypsibius exemplaris]|uniref:Ester hydrolase C11orf54-like protein n=1 Tax=Hypsibius exemplaris TaxID=2072580 RepID=A0A1W0WDZ8_HYPEX|nr:Ester hydrolase C11orf54-like protein [Hypsibius exemplaris]
MAETLSVEKLELRTVGLDDIATVFQAALEANFTEVSVAVVDCPDLTLPPYRMAARGLSGSTKIADVGGVRYLTPTPQLDHIYSLRDVGKLTGSNDGCFVIGAGAGPFQETGCNCELMADAFISTEADHSKIVSQTAKLNKDGKCVVTSLTTPSLAILGNFFVSKGEPGKVIEIRAKRRTGADDLIACLRKSLARQFGGTPVGVGGVFLVQKGRVNIHVMPDFSKTPLATQDEVDKWLQYFEFPAPMIFQSVFVSEDPGLDLRLEHSHGHSLLDEKGECEHSHGGHYHYDTTPDEVEYVGFFNAAEALYRIDRPKGQ